MNLPPIYRDSIEDDLLAFLDCVEELPIHDYKRNQKYIELVPDDTKLLHVEITPCEWELDVERDLRTGELTGFTERRDESSAVDGSRTMSMRRKPDLSGFNVKGSSGNLPFWPAGFQLPEIEDYVSTEKSELETCAPDMTSGISVPNTNANKHISDMTSLTISDMFSTTDLYKNLIELSNDSQPDEDIRMLAAPGREEVDKFIQTVEPAAEEPNVLSNLKVFNIKEPETPSRLNTGTEFAIKLDVNKPVENFHQKIPDMAYKWPFELDPFQQQAVVCLENHDSVFVAAHTSAGKTVVAEYAIALCRKHMTKAIYTSPVKALSNQKFRDFKSTFGDVGLITGDIQLNADASCLIMTTEILRSMLYGGSDVIRDVEWVIFDEAHYINDVERGVVWEEVLIMLPAHVNIILLSATVPNYMQFADWVGRTKERKVHVISTSKRPVPLEHYLYTGNSNKTSEELFLLVDSQSKLHELAYKKALAAKKERQSNLSKTMGAKGPKYGVRPNEEKNIYLSVIHMLKKKEKLPAVVFTLSKKRIEETTSYLSSVDLTSSTEKSQIHVFINKSIERLRGSDKNLPQVRTLSELLKRGVGVHHSGILPILKEIVELLFQKGLLKILFATETFAMGVNMPARTVVFDSIKKHDGTAFRDLKPAEYIQMAGRAGRRGLDTTGTVIILCKGDVPELSDLNRMMLGKMTLLESRFRLTYTMMLNLLRVEKLRIQDMLKRSFSEFTTQKDENRNREKLHQLRKRVRELKNIDCFFCSSDMELYYSTCKQYSQLRHELMTKVVTHPSCVKMLSSGRLVILSTNQITVLGVILNNNNRSPRIYKILVLSDKNATWWKDELKSRYTNPPVEPVTALILSPHGEDRLAHTLLEIESSYIHTILTQTITVTNPEKIIDDIQKRQLPRFRDNPIGQTTRSTIEDLLLYNTTNITDIQPVTQFNIRDIDTVEKFTQLYVLQATLLSCKCNQCPEFNKHFAEVGENVKIKDDFQQIKFLLSDASLLLLPEYKQRLDVLHHLQYTNSDRTVQLKGRVACELRQHELLLTELIFNNEFSHLHFTEIVALLSCVVFEQKNASKPKLTTKLEQGVSKIQSMAEYLGQIQQDRVADFIPQDYVSSLKFGLVEVVYEWARGMSFCEIVALTDVQEGIIVRCIQRLDIVLGDIKDAARIVGDPILAEKMVEASNSIKRDIVFAASLYTQ